MRKRLHVNDLIAEPGTVEIDWGSLYSYTTSEFSMPSAIKWTPEGNSLYWGRTEFSANFDRQAIINNNVALSKAARVFDVPVVFSTVACLGGEGQP